MAAYLSRRLVQAVVVVIGVTIIAFVLVHLLPGGPRALLGPKTTARQLHRFIVHNGYNRPIFVQYVRYLGNLLKGNLGYSFHYNQSVGSLLVQNLPKSALLVGLAYGLAFVVGVPLGLLQAVRRNRISDYVLTGLSFIGYSMPVFWLGILLILALAVNLHVFPAEGPQGATVGAVLSDPGALVLPVVTLSIVSIAVFSRYTRSSAVETLVQDHIRTARAKGVTEHRIVSKHVLRNSLLPVISLIGLSLPAALSGAVVVESVFNYPGMGLLFWNAALSHDYSVLLGFTVVVSAATVVGSLLADLLYAVADPRIRYA
jgi:peptide/nickel transport system permease protein